MPIETATEPPMRNIARQMNKIVDQLQKGYYNFAPSEVWTPNVNLYETDAAYNVCVDLAGVEKEKIDITVTNHVLTLRGRRSVPLSPDGEISDDNPHRVRVHLMEVDHGAFARDVELPQDVAQDRIEARYVDGLLWINLPKRPQAGEGQRPIPVQANDQQP